MVLHLDSRAERLIEEQLGTGRFQTAEEVVARALESLGSGFVPHRNTADEVQAVDDLIEFAKKHKLSLGEGVTIRDLINEGRKY